MYRQYSFLLVFPLLFTFGVLIVLSDGNHVEQNRMSGAVNSVLGNESYVKRFGELPRKETSEWLRIKTHLKYVEKILRSRSLSHLSDQQKENRVKNLNHLRDYHQQGEFPVNDGYAEMRRPTFIGHNGNICAVGYLVQQSLGRKAAEALNERFKHEYVMEIEDPIFRKWVESSGFTIHELAMIQPQYEPVIVEKEKRNRNRIGLSYGIGSTLLASANGLYLSNRSDTPWLFINSSSNHWFGLAAGTSSVLLGAMNLDNTQSFLEPLYSEDICLGIACPPLRKVTTTNRARTALSIANMGVGFISMIRSGYHLIQKPDETSSNTSLGVTQLDANPIEKGEMVPAVQLRVRF